MGIEERLDPAYDPCPRAGMILAIAFAGLILQAAGYARADEYISAGVSPSEAEEAMSQLEFPERIGAYLTSPGRQMRYLAE